MEEQKIALLFLCGVLVFGIIGTVVSIMPADTGAATTTYSTTYTPQRTIIDLTPKGTRSYTNTYYPSSYTRSYLSSINPAYSTIRTQTQIQPRYAQSQQIDLGVRPKSEAQIAREGYYWTCYRLSPKMKRVTPEQKNALDTANWNCVGPFDMINGDYCCQPMPAQTSKPSLQVVPKKTRLSAGIY